MKRNGGEGPSRLELTAAALVPAGLGLARPILQLAGRLSWLGPLLALPVGLCLGPLWKRLGRKGLEEGLEEAFGPLGGKWAAGAYFLWALVLLADAGRQYAWRLGPLAEGEGARRLFLLSALGLCLWLGRRGGSFLARTGRLFFRGTVAALGLSLVLSLRGIDWKNFFPPLREDWTGLPGAGALCLSLTGYGVYMLCLPCRREAAPERSRLWSLGWSGWFAALLFLEVGVFGPTLAGRLEDPFYYLLEGVGLPGVFQRGEAALTALLALADLALLALLSRGVRSLWEKLAPPLPGLGCLAVAAAFFLAGVLSETERAWGWLMGILPRGNLIFGILLPLISVLTIKAKEREKRRSTFCGDDPGREEDIGEKEGGEKSGGENEKKC